jgi:hypothetical protein
MPNPVAVNDLSPISGSLQTSRVSYGVETAGKNYGQNYNSTNWYSDIPNNGQFYTIISDNYTANYYVSRSNAGGAYVEGGLPAVDEYSAPVFWVTVGTSSLDVITIVNGLPDRIGQTPFNSGSQALNWIASSSNYFAVGPDYYEQIDADNLGLYIHGNQIISYPTTGSTWYDISGQNNRFNLINGPTYNSNGWINFDGSDDYAVAVNTTLPSNTTSSFTLTAVARTSGGGTYQTVLGTGGLLSQIGFYSNNAFMYGRNGGGGGLLYTNGGTIATGRFYHLTMTYNGSTATAYLNGVATQTGVNIGSNGGTNGVHVLSSYTPSAASEILTGDIAQALVYPKALTAAEVAQNYYGGPIVTSGLVFALDAGNLVSYPKSGTAWYNLTGSVNGTLTNGPTFSPKDGGVIVFDGTDDYINTTYNSAYDFANANFSIEAWFYANIVPNGTYEIICTRATYGANERSFELYIANDTGTPYIWFGVFNSNWTYVNNPALTNIQYNQWNHVVATSDGAGNGKVYINGVLKQTNSSFNTAVTSTTVPVQIGAYVGGAVGGFFNGNIASVNLYNRGLTADEVLQNYNATK